jgi:hypothetical protein
MSPPRKPRFGPPEIIFLFVLGLLALIVFTGNARRLIDAIFTPTAVLIIVIVLFEYLILRGSDRSEIYKRELEAARKKRRDDLLALREIEAQLLEMNRRIDQALAHQAGILSQGSSGNHMQELKLLRETAQKLQERVRERI